MDLGCREQISFFRAGGCKRILQRLKIEKERERGERERNGGERICMPKIERERKNKLIKINKLKKILREREH